MYYVFAGVWGFGQGARIANALSVITSFCNENCRPILFGLHLLFSGIGSIIIPMLQGDISKADSILQSISL